MSVGWNLGLTWQFPTNRTGVTDDNWHRSHDVKHTWILSASIISQWFFVNCPPQIAWLHEPCHWEEPLWPILSSFIQSYQFSMLFSYFALLLYKKISETSAGNVWFWAPLKASSSTVTDGQSGMKNTPMMHDNNPNCCIIMSTTEMSSPSWQSLESGVGVEMWNCPGCFYFFLQLI